MFKKLAVAATLLAGTAILPMQAVVAQDVYATGQTQGFFEKSGWYVGADLGGAFNPGADEWNCNNCANAVNKINNIIDNKGNSGVITGGFYGGYMYKWEAPITTGLEIDFNGLGDFRKNDSFSCTAPSATGFCSVTNLPPGPYNLTLNRNTNFFGTLRGHFAYILAPNQEVYFSGGFAYAGNSGAGQATATGPTSSVVIRNNNNTTKTGSVFGAGYSYAFNDNMALRIEGMYINLKSQDRNFTIPITGVTYNLDESIKFHFTVVRVGFTYKFDL